MLCFTHGRPPISVAVAHVEPSGVQALKNPKPFEGC